MHDVPCCRRSMVSGFFGFRRPFGRTFRGTARIILDFVRIRPHPACAEPGRTQYHPRRRIRVQETLRLDRMQSARRFRRSARACVCRAVSGSALGSAPLIRRIAAFQHCLDPFDDILARQDLGSVLAKLRSNGVSRGALCGAISGQGRPHRQRRVARDPLCPFDRAFELLAGRDYFGDQPGFESVVGVPLLAGKQPAQTARAVGATAPGGGDVVTIRPALASSPATKRKAATVCFRRRRAAGP